jgi:hypothetical protein
MDVYIVMAYRFGGMENVFPIGVFETYDAALAAAKWHHQRRGGKYEHRILPVVLGNRSDKGKTGVMGSTVEQQARFAMLAANRVEDN